MGDAFVEQGGEHSKKIKAVYQTRPSALFELTFSSCSGDIYLLRRVSTFHLTNNGEAGGPPIFKISQCWCQASNSKRGDTEDGKLATCYPHIEDIMEII